MSLRTVLLGRPLRTDADEQIRPAQGIPVLGLKGGPHVSVMSTPPGPKPPGRAQGSVSDRSGSKRAMQSSPSLWRKVSPTARRVSGLERDGACRNSHPCAAACLSRHRGHGRAVQLFS